MNQANVVEIHGLQELENPVFAELEFINITPWWGGRHVANTVVCLDNECKHIYIAKPTAATVKGVIRYILRLAIASYIPTNILNEYGYRACETYPHILFEEVPTRIPTLLEFLLGSVRRSTALQGIVGIDVKAQISKESSLYIDYYNLVRILRKPYGKLIEELERDGYSLLRGVGKLTLCTHREIKDFCKLFAIPRMRLLAQECRKYSGKEFFKCLFERQPLRERSVQLKVRLTFTRPIYAQSRFIEEVKKLFIYATIFALTFLGIGKASSRGFGKFILTKIGNLDIADGSEQSYLRSLSQWFNNFSSYRIEDVAKVVDTLRGKILESLRNVILEYAKMFSVDIGDLKIFRDIAKVPRLSNLEILRIENPVHPCMVAQNEMIRKGRLTEEAENYCTEKVKANPKSALEPSDVLKILSAIGKACLKSTWKIYCERTPITTGFKYHTWCLGLPRSVHDYKRRKITGYIVVSVDKLGPVDKIVDDKTKTCSNVDSWCCSYRALQSAEEESVLKRWRSPFIFTPLIDREATMLHLLILMLKYSDIEDVLQGIQLHGSKVMIVHVGAHTESDKFHVIELHGGIVNSCIVKSSCGEDQVGVAYPPTRCELKSVRGFADVFEVAKQWIVYLLSR